MKPALKSAIWHGVAAFLLLLAGGMFSMLLRYMGWIE